MPSLPSHSLISILAKFPADIDSRVFWTSPLRDLLFNAVFAVIHVLVARIEQRKNENDDGAYPPDPANTSTPVALHVAAKSYNHQLLQQGTCSSIFRISDHSSASSHSDSADPIDVDVEDEDGENDADSDISLSDDSRACSDSELRTPSSATAASSTTPSVSPSDPPAPASTPSAIKIICSTILLENLESRHSWLKLWSSACCFRIKTRLVETEPSYNVH
ncbi:hypothetical protein BT96DRAFT_1009016 [Gymnopus androsaceus JB14]|uniref:Uncharacterized protein n=1 Tax=Gymnopus androsaceus JB14 TaxID=1447944 RepID=A0A6A4GDD8_9AGAR|nr:hypothetical protein BT96DRAFT_1009016 [Gymnopus androsaceus JB14]